jgi:DNA-binding beta-propeller fold protein YncE
MWKSIPPLLERRFPMETRLPFPAQVFTILLFLLTAALIPRTAPPAGAAEEVGPDWVARYDGPSGGFEAARAMALDKVGNVYIAGTTSRNGQGGTDMLVTIKYDRSGKELWVVQGLLGMPAAIATDPEGNIIVAVSAWTDHGIDAGTIKLDPHGNALWSRTYDGPEHFHDDPAGMALDAAGNIFIAASQNHEDEDVSIEILKYDPDGTLLRAAHDAPRPRWARAIACDAAGNALVLGKTGWGEGLVLLKYGGSGDLDWQRTEETSPPYDGAASLALDAGGSAHVVAWMSTFKYDPEGNRVWAADRPGSPWAGSSSAISVDLEGNVGIASMTDQEPPCLLIIEYDPEGHPLWESGGDPIEPASSDIELAMDAEGNLLVACSSTQDSRLIKCDSKGNRAWERTSPRGGDDGPRDLAVDGLGNSHLILRETTLATGPDIVTRKYASDGSRLWESRYDRPGHASDHAGQIVVDPASNIIVSGWSEAAGRGVEYATVKYDRGGNQLWAARYDPPGSMAGFKDLLADPDGNILVTGLFQTSWSPQLGDAITLKYDRNGNLLWEAILDGSGSLDPCLGGEMAMDRWGNVVVAGSLAAADAAGMGYLTAKIDRDGKQMWTKRYVISPGYACYVVGIAVDEEGNAAILGNNSRSPHVVKYRADGELLWEAFFNGDDGHETYPQEIAADRSGNVYIACTNDVDPVRASTHVVKYDSRGARRWAACEGTFEVAPFWPVAMAADAGGNLLVTGCASSAEKGGPDFATLKYDPDGNLLWRAAFQGSAGADDEPWGIALDPAGNIHVGGKSTSADGSADFVLVTYSPAGEELRVARAAEAGAADWAGGVAADSAGNVFLTGSRSDPDRLMDFVTIKFDAVLQGDRPFIRGESNADGRLDLTDAVFTLLHLFLGGREPSCLKSADTDDSGVVELTDAIRLLRFLFLGGGAPEAPFPGCGGDGTPDALTCSDDPSCS